MKTRRWSLLPPLLLLACGGEDPILTRAEALSEAKPGATPSPTAPPQPTPGAPVAPQPAPAGAPQAGVPAAPTPGSPTEPPPGGGPGAGPQGPTVTLSGTIELPQYSGGAVRIDVFDGDQQQLGGPRPQVVGMARVASPGAYTVQVPQSASKVWVGAFVDVDGDGRPGPGEPSGWYAKNPVATGADATNINLSLAVDSRPPPTKGGLQ